MSRPLSFLACALAIACGPAGCVERELIATSSPSGALVTANGHEIGRTPMGREFQWYGYYDTTVRMDGYEPQRQVTSVVAPPWLWFPFDLVMELLPFTIRDEHNVAFTLEPTTAEQLDPAGMVSRGRELQTQLESGTMTVVKQPTTHAADKR